MQNKENWNACKGISIDRGGVDNLLRRSQPQWVENFSRMCRADREHKILARWIDLSVEKLSRSNLEISIKEVSIEILSRRYWEITQKSRWIENLSRICQEDKKHRKNSWWIEKLSRILLSPEEESSIERNLSRMCRKAVELEERRFFKKGKTYRDECNK